MAQNFAFCICIVYVYVLYKQNTVKLERNLSIKRIHIKIAARWQVFLMYMRDVFSFLRKNNCILYV